METSESILELAKSMSMFQSEVANPKLDGDNPHFSSKFSTLSEIINTIRPTLTKHGLSFMQMTKTQDSQVGVSTLVLHNSGQFIQSDFIWIPIPKPNAQGVGAAITYGRRFSLGATLGISTETDDDGNSISDKNKGGQQSQPPNNYSKNNNNTKSSNSNSVKMISEPQKKALGAKLGELVKLYNNPDITRDSLIAKLEEVKEIGVFGSITGLTASKASQCINKLDIWINKVKANQGESK